VVTRARIILMANEECLSNQRIADLLGTTKANVTQWTKRWIERALEPIRDRLSDQPRSGRPDTITAEQWCRITALACEPPAEHGHPISHWSSAELAAEAVKQGIVEQLSAGHLRKVLAQATLQPHRSRYWLNAKADAETVVSGQVGTASAGTRYNWTTATNVTLRVNLPAGTWINYASLKNTSTNTITATASSAAWVWFGGSMTNSIAPGKKVVFGWAFDATDNTTNAFRTAVNN
jgi:transposase